ncbi:MAG: winged helix-turn-helix transcriptional regulator [bacterium]|nr:winged helix-turn-helix transcriptional regulator [bacterium]
MRSSQLDLVFSALADPTRRGMLERLAEGETNVGTLAAPHDMSQPAVSKHLRVLERAGLIQRTRHGREHRIRVDPRPIEAASTWIEHYTRFWKQQFDAVDAYLEARAKQTHPPQRSKERRKR